MAADNGHSVQMSIDHSYESDSPPATLVSWVLKGMNIGLKEY